MGKSSKSQKTQAQSKNQSDNGEKPSQLIHLIQFIPLIAAVIAALGLIIVAIINRSTAIETTLKPIEFTQTAEAFHTSVAITQTTEALETSAAMTETANVLGTSNAMTQTTEALETAIAVTQTAEALETSIAITKTADAIATSVAMTQTAEMLRTTVAMTNQAAKPSINTPLPSSSYGGLTFGCVPTKYWYVDNKANSDLASCWDLSKWGLLSDSQLIRIDVDNSSVIEKTLSMIIPKDIKDIDILFRLVVKDMQGDSDKIAPKFAIGICEPNKFRYEHAFVYYDLSKNELASAVTVNSFDKKDNYYFYNNVVRDYRLEVRSYDLMIYVNNISIHSPITIKRTDSTSFCIYYVLPDGGSLHTVVDEIYIDKK